MDQLLGSRSREHAAKTAVATIVASAIAGGAALLVPPVRAFLKALPGYILTLFHWLGAPVEVARWHYWVLAVSCIGVAVFALMVIIDRLRSSVPAYTSYTQDQFFGIIWRWHYSSRQGIGNPRPYCPQCDRLMVYRFDRDFHMCHVICENCNLARKFEGTPDHLENRVRREIDVKLRNDQWVSIVQQQSTSKV